MLVFEVQGSGKKPYTVKAYGDGLDLEMWCTCPAGSRGGKFCKHVSALLVGDVTKLVSGSELMDELLQRAEGSHLQSRAMVTPASDSFANVTTIDDLDRAIRATLESAGWGVVKTVEQDPWYTATLALHSHFKNGKMKKVSTHQLSFEAETADLVWHDDGHFTYENRHPSPRPWRLRSKTLSTARSYKNASTACAEFAKLAEQN